MYLIAEWKISPRRGDGNFLVKRVIDLEEVEWKISPRRGDGNSVAIPCTTEYTQNGR